MYEAVFSLYRETPAARDYFSFPVLWGALCETYGEPQTLEGDARERCLSDARRLLAGYPLQYFLGECEFYSRRFLCREGVLIPRADTEVLVECALPLLGDEGTFYDFCTGSGCIAVTLLAERERAVGIAVDVSEQALSLTQENAALCGVLDRLLIRRRDLLREAGGSKQLDLLCMNPPYIRTAVLETLPENVRREPALALDGGADGLVFYRRVLSRLSEYVKPTGHALFEIGYDQGADLMRLASAYGYAAELIADAEGRDRVVKITLAKNRNL